MPEWLSLSQKYVAVRLWLDKRIQAGRREPPALAGTLNPKFTILFSLSVTRKRERFGRIPRDEQASTKSIRKSQNYTKTALIFSFVRFGLGILEPVLVQISSRGRTVVVA